MTAGADESLRGWLGRRIGVWQQIEERTKRLARGRKHEVDEANALVDGYRMIARDLAVARHLLPGSRVTRFLEAQYLRAHALIARPANSLWSDLGTLLVEDVPAITRELSSYIVAVTALFVLSGLAGAWLIMTFPELVTLVASEQMIATVEGGNLWTDDILNVVPSSMLSVQILANNVSVSLFAYGVGIIFGLGTFYIIALNGLMIGGIFAFTYQHHLAMKLLTFVAAHGPVELTTICLAGAAGAVLGESLIRPRAGTRAESFRLAVARTSRYLVFCALLLIVCGFIEGYISPNDSYPLASRAVIGLAWWMIAVMAMTGVLYRSRRRV
jgi:uncharacterized membrane protein SpoIIM required for sporulation